MKTLVLGVLVGSVAAIDNGLGRSPPMGWRSWNCYHQGVTQEKMIAVSNAFVNKSRGLSLLDVGYVNVGLDDYYQACGTGVDKSFHNASGYPLIDKEKFPDMKAMTDHAHSLGLRMGWYANNCGCNEHQDVPSWGPYQTTGKLKFGRGPLTDGLYHYQNEVQATIDFGFDGIKLDGCGEFLNLTVFANLFNRTGREILIENCHWGRDGPGDWGDGGSLNAGPNKVPAEKWCPFNFFRTSGDISSNWGSVMRNLKTVDQHQPWTGTPDQVKTGPGCFAYPDMLEVGQLSNFVEDRSHFGAWVINSAPLILGHDLTDDTRNDLVWPIITNKAAIAVSQSFEEGLFPHPGGFVKSLNPSGPPSDNYYLTADPPTTSFELGGRWSFTNGSAIKHNPSGLCVDAQSAMKQGQQFMLKPCNGQDSQNWVMEQNGNLHSVVGSDMCLAVEDFNGPGVVSWGCNTGNNEEFVYDAATGSLCCKEGGRGHKAHCLDASQTNPHGGGGGGNEILVYAKPQPKGAVAVLFINNADGNTTASIDLADLRFDNTHGSDVMDVWEQKNIQPLAPDVKTLTTDSFGSHDSRFFLLTPKKA